MFLYMVYECISFLCHYPEFKKKLSVCEQVGPFTLTLLLKLWTHVISHSNFFSTFLCLLQVSFLLFFIIFYLWFSFSVPVSSLGTSEFSAWISFSAIIHSYHVFSSSFFPVNNLCLKISKANSTDQETQIQWLNYWPEVLL